jgi:hypothetical protein
VDPIIEKFPWVTPYNYAENEPVGSIDLWGLQRVKVIGNYLMRERNVLRRKMTEGGAYLRFPNRVSNVGRFEPGSTNISSVSARTARHVAENDNMTTDIGSERNAFRHVFWSAKMTQKFGIPGANEIGKAHEGIGPYSEVEYFSNEPFEGRERGADSTIDLFNNLIGQAIGEANPDANNTELGIMVLDEFRKNGLFTIQVAADGSISIIRQRITEDQYNRAVETLNTLDENGLNEEERN